MKFSNQELKIKIVIWSFKAKYLHFHTKGHKESHHNSRCQLLDLRKVCDIKTNVSKKTEPGTCKMSTKIKVLQNYLTVQFLTPLLSQYKQVTHLYHIFLPLKTAGLIIIQLICKLTFQRWLQGLRNWVIHNLFGGILHLSSCWTAQSLLFLHLLENPAKDFQV